MVSLLIGFMADAARCLAVERQGFEDEGADLDRPLPLDEPLRLPFLLPLDDRPRPRPLPRDLPDRLPFPENSSAGTTTG